MKSDKLMEATDDSPTLKSERAAAALRAENAKLRSLNKQYLESLDAAEKSLSVYEECVNWRLGKKLPKRKGDRNVSPATAILCCNDWHCEENVDPAVVGGINEFNLEIANRRIEYLWTRFASLIDASRKLSNIREAVLWLGGDLINNQLHEESAESNFLGPTEATLWLMPRISQGIHFLLDNCGLERITVATSYGNHGRTTVKRRVSTGYRHSWEWMLYNVLARSFAGDKRVSWSIAKGYHNLVNVQDHWIRFHHGDSVRFHGGIGGVSVPFRRKIAQWNKSRTVLLDIAGHFHQFDYGWNYCLSGSLVGHNAYAIEIGAEPQPPTQAYLVIDRDRGCVEARWAYVEGK